MAEFEHAQATLALQGLEGLEDPSPDDAAIRAYDGPAEPDALLAHVGLLAFRTGQRQAVEAALAGRDALIVMPTGGGNRRPARAARAAPGPLRLRPSEPLVRHGHGRGQGLEGAQAGAARARPPGCRERPSDRLLRHPEGHGVGRRVAA